MMNVYDALRQLERSIKDSQEHKKYQELKIKVSEKEETKEILLDIRKKQMEVQTFLMMQQEIPEEKMKELEQVNNLLQFHPTINEFLQAEYMMSKIYEDIMKAVTQTFNFEPFEVKDNGKPENE